jgi:plastocyanin
VFLALSVASLIGCETARETTRNEATKTHPVAERGPPTPATQQGRPVAEAPPEKPNQVVIDNFRFQPRTLTVPAGTKVTWVNRDDVPHTATSTAKPRAFDSKTLDTDEQFAFVFATPGSYEYFCAVHPHMTGTVIVK